MKRLISKKSGFTLAEIIIAFAVFAIMAAMIMQVIHLTINRRIENNEFEKDLQSQEQTLIARGQNWDAYDSTKPIDGSFDLDLKDAAGNVVVPMTIEYQAVSVDGEINEKAGLNYFVGNIAYAEGGAGSEFEADSPEGGDPGDIGGGSQMDRFDTRLTGTKGINSIVISYSYNASDDEYTFSVKVNDSGVDSAIKSHSQVSLFFGEGESGGAMATIKELNGNTTDQYTLKYVKKAGNHGVNIHCSGDGFNGSTTTFKVKFNETIENLAFGDNASGNTYTMYPGYPNIFGAYAKAGS